MTPKRHFEINWPLGVVHKWRLTLFGYFRPPYLTCKAIFENLKVQFFGHILTPKPYPEYKRNLWTFPNSVPNDIFLQAPEFSG